MDIDLQWELLAQADPYVVIAGEQQFTRDQFCESRDHFFATGENHVANVFQIIESSLGTPFTPGQSLDFGCGAGRILIPLARRSIKVVGIDVSKTMRQLCATHFDEQGFSPPLLLPDADDLAEEDRFDLIHSYITLQHIPCDKGIAIISKLLDRLNPGGVAALHMTYHEHPLRRGLRSLLRDAFRNLALHRIARTTSPERPASVANIPPMMMEDYSLNRVFLTHQERALSIFSLQFTDHAGCPGVFIFSQKPTSKA